MRRLNCLLFSNGGQKVMSKKSVLLVLTGGTIAMTQDPATGALRPTGIEEVKRYMPELFQDNILVDFYSFNPLVDSSNITPPVWGKLATIIYENYNLYDGFVVLHGTDTMSYSASALSFMLRNLGKPVVFTGSQLPMGLIRSDARENLLTAIEIAVEQDEEGQALVPEVSIFFGDRLYRGNRTTKKNAEYFSAFKSYNYEPLALAGVHIRYNTHLIHYPDPLKPLRLWTTFDKNVAILKIFPGISRQVVEAVLNIPDLRAIVLETFGAGNAPSEPWLYEVLKNAIAKGLIVVNKTQCSAGSVEMGRYETSLNLLEAGVISGRDITTEAVLTKLMYLLGEYGDDTDKVKNDLQISLCGEMTMEEL